jgi:hypothetical protein
MLKNLATAALMFALAACGTPDTVDADALDLGQQTQALAASKKGGGTTDTSGSTTTTTTTTTKKKGGKTTPSEPVEEYTSVDVTDGAAVVDPVVEETSAAPVAPFVLAASASIEAPSFSDSFVIAETTDLHLALDVSASAVGGHNVATVFVDMPGGSAYQRFDVAFATNVVADPGELQAEPTATGYRIWITLPVAGTWIEQYQLSGTWTAEAYVNNSTSANASLAFTLE